MISTSRGWDAGNWNHHDFYAIHLGKDWNRTTNPENIASDNGFVYDSVQAQDREDLHQHLLVQTCFGAGNSLLRHPVVLSELYRSAQNDPQGCKILLARSKDVRHATNIRGKGSIIGSIILYHASSQMSRYFPLEDRKFGGLLGVVAARGPSATPVIDGLISKSLSILIEMGFSRAQTFIVSDLTLQSVPKTKLIRDMCPGRRLSISSKSSQPGISEGIRVSQYQPQDSTDCCDAC